jgi:hypothetical protein
MKKFSQFINESRSIASIQGRRLGLVPDGHGGYHDKNTGEFIAKNVNGRLKFYNQNQILGKQDPKQIRTQNNQRPVATQTKLLKKKVEENSNLRERYIRGEIFCEGQYVQNLNTQLVGKIVRRGTNHLICVTEDGEMFKSWISDVVEWTDDCGVPASQREVGTDSLRKYTMKMSDVKSIRNFINKYKKKA